MLAEYGCDEAQGFLYGHPTPGEQIVAAVQARRAGLRLVRPTVPPGLAMQGVAGAAKEIMHA